MKTTKFSNMITAFCHDFTLAKDKHMSLSELDNAIRNGDEKLLRDIELLQELEHGLRHGKYAIIEEDINYEL